MDYHFECPHCYRVFSLSDENIGQVIECPVCADAITIPPAHPQQTPYPIAGQTATGISVEMKPHRSMMLLGLGILSLLLCAPLGILTYSLAGDDLAKMDRGLMDPAGRTVTFIAKILGLIGIVIFVFIILVSFIIPLFLFRLFRL